MLSPTSSDNVSKPLRLSEILHILQKGHPKRVLSLKYLLNHLNQNALGIFLLIVIIPAFIPIPGFGGAVSGPLVMLLGLQMMIGLRQPWLPRFLGRRGPQRQTLSKFTLRMEPWLQRLDRYIKPRLLTLIDPLWAHIFSGILLFSVGLLLALPIPFTNYVFGFLLLLFATAFIGRDGFLLLMAWIISSILIALTIFSSGNIIHLFTK